MITNDSDNKKRKIDDKSTNNNKIKYEREIEINFTKKIVNKMLLSPTIHEDYEESARTFKLLISLLSLHKDSILQLLTECNFGFKTMNVLLEFLEKVKITLTPEYFVEIIFKIAFENGIFSVQALQFCVLVRVEYFEDPEFHDSVSQLICFYNL